MLAFVGFCWLKTLALDLTEGQCCSPNVGLLGFFLGLSWPNCLQRSSGESQNRNWHQYYWHPHMHMQNCLHLCSFLNLSCFCILYIFCRSCIVIIIPYLAFRGEQMKNFNTLGNMTINPADCLHVACHYNLPLQDPNSEKIGEIQSVAF